MKMRRFLFNKLTRDKTVELLKESGSICATKKLDENGDFLEALTQKVVEELEEVFDSQSQEELIVELADFEEVLDTFKRLLKIDQKDIDDVRKAKNAERGAFENRVFIEHVDIPETATEELEYVTGQPDRYPEVDPKTGNFLESDNDDEEED
jgi:predicted house-cleaning noncanonical NTP pyrophosphatase (MazG superfamily)